MSSGENEESPAAAEPVVVVRSLWAGYGSRIVLEDVSITIHENDFIGLLGPNGGGKTTFLKVLMGLIAPWRGEVRILGRSPREGRRHIGFVPQLIEMDRDFPLTARDVVRMGRLDRTRLFRGYGRDDERVVDEVLERVGMSSEADSPIGELSGGQRQRVYIARALAAHPKILLLDEPMANVDPNVRGTLYELLKEVNEEAAVLMVTHDISAVSAHVKTIGCLDRRLFYHGEKFLRPEMLDQTYGCPVDLIAHGVPHRVLAEHGNAGGRER